MKNNKKFLSTFILGMSSIALFGCTSTNSSSSSIGESSVTSQESSQVHTHTKATAYSFDENGHYYKCAGCDENIRFDYEAHSLVEKDGVLSCSICSYAPYEENNKLYKTLRDGLNNFLNDEEDVTFDYVKVEANDTNKTERKETCKGTFDRKNGTFYTTITSENTYSGNTSSSLNTTYISNENGQYKDYKSAPGRPSQTYQYYQADSNTAQRLYDSFTESAIDLELINRINAFDDFEELSHYLNFYLGNGFADFTPNYSFSVTENSLTFNIGYRAISTNSNTLYEDFTYDATLTITDGRLSGYSHVYNYDSMWANGNEQLESKGITTNIKKGFDTEFYNSFSDKDSYTDTGLGTLYKITLYYQDYKLVSYNQRINEKLSNAIYDQYGSYYYDKEYTRPYNGENLTSEVNALYLKPKEDVSSEQALVISLTDYDYVSPYSEALSYNEKKIYGAPSFFDAGYSYPLLITYESVNPQIIVNGTQLTPYTTTQSLEGGKTYIIIYKRTYFAF